MRRVALLFLLTAACVPADGSFALGSATFTIKTTVEPERGFTMTDETIDREFWYVKVDRIVLGLRTMTIGKVGDDDRCAFRGRGDKSDIVFDPRSTLVQTFNGITPANCEDVGVFLSPPGDTTEVGPGVTSADLVELVQGAPAHAILDATARHGDETFKLHFRFDTLRTSSRFGGCQGRFEAKGIRVRANERVASTVSFAPENMFQEGLGFGARLRLDPFRFADAAGDDDGVFTMEDADAFSLGSLRFRGVGDGYQLPNGTTAGTFGDYLRALFRFTFFFRETGTCVGNEPGTE